MLRQLVLIPSAPKDDKREIIERVLRPLESWGFECDTLGDSESPALIASLGEGGVLFSGHLDTVPVGAGWSVGQGETRGSTLYGRGASDMKGGCAAMMMAAEELAKRRASLSLAFTTDEETGMKGAESVARHGAVSEAPVVIVCEPTSLCIGAREKGLLQFRISTSGKCAHAAMPEMGINANHKMLDALERLKSLVSVSADPMDSTTMNVGVLRGGDKVNVIPDSCTAEIDIRTPADIDPDRAWDLVKEKLAGSDIELQMTNKLSPIQTPRESMAVKLVERLRGGVGFIDIAYATEMVKYKEANKNLLAIGPGDPRQAHVADEHVDVHEIAEAAMLYRDICLNLRT